MNNRCDINNKKIKLEILLSIVHCSMYFLFIYLCVFKVDLLRAKLFNSNLPISFAFGLMVIFSGVVLTFIYVFITNRKKDI
ncbi:DUF485 domain-containing protein [Vibrio viridaestus]|uniref:DUF485 domain-containing protein n=1 Tax=Vibrio viridaestus TaxID=2487322 RepID=A0A3N9TAB8_9VIBR|nr:DUF485 domain-containing protein [Vibrio viridaestus]